MGRAFRSDACKEHRRKEQSRKEPHTKAQYKKASVGPDGSPTY